MGDIGGKIGLVAGGLFGDAAQGGAFGLGLYDANGFPIHKKDVIGRAGLGGELAHGDAQASAQVEGMTVLDDPAGGS